MCILILKPKKVSFPEKEILKQCFDNNPDGCGYAWIDRSGISHIRKGFLNFDKFYKDLSKNMEKIMPFDTIIHFRFATHGSVVPGNTHPFPISCDINDLKSTNLNGRFKIMAHNGVIPSLSHRAKKTKNDLSDTMVFAKELKVLGENNPNIKNILESGKFVIMDRSGSRRYGKFIEDNGIFYSNDSYLSFDKIWLKSSCKMDLYPCKMDINKKGECIYSHYCNDQGYCEISGYDIIDLIGIKEYEDICPILKNEDRKRDILKKEWLELKEFNF
mgnify:CR=1 FL=1